MYEIIGIAVMVVLLAISVVTDLRTGKIYNKLTLPCALAGLGLGIMDGGWRGGADHLAGAALMFAVVLLLSPLARLGGGDAKLLIAVGALQGGHFATWTLLFTGVAGGVLALVVMIRRRIVRQTALTMAANLFARASGVSADLAAASPGGKMKYSLAITAGALATLILQI